MKIPAARYAVLLLVLISLTAAYFAYRSIPREPRVDRDDAGVAERVPQREVILYFGSMDGFSLVAEAREVNDGDERQLITEIVRALGEGPRDELIPVLPQGTRLLGYDVQETVATLDFSNALVAAHPGGSMSELLTIYGLANTLAVNFPHIRKVRILVEGRPVETLKGHVDLRQPIAADFRFTGPSSGDVAPSRQENS